MTMDELMRKILEILPDASFDEDLDGQIVIYTNKRCTENQVTEYEQE